MTSWGTVSSSRRTLFCGASDDVWCVWLVLHPYAKMSWCFFPCPALPTQRTVSPIYEYVETVAYRGGGGVQTPPPPEIPKALQNRAKHNPIVKTVKNWWIFDANTSRCSEKKGSNILKLPPVRNCFTLAMTNKLVVIINSLKVPKIKEILLYEMKFLVRNYSCLQNPCLGATAPRFHSSVLSWICWTPPPPNKFLGMPLNEDETIKNGHCICQCLK